MPKEPSSLRRRGQKREVVYDPEARKAHLRGFSERKRQRRAYGLAMQKVKDRKKKIEDRAESKKDELERVEEAERQKAECMKETLQNSSSKMDDDDGEDASDGDDGSRNEFHDEERNEQVSDVLAIKKYDDLQTESHWGGHVTVTTSVVDLGDGVSSDDEETDLASSSAAPLQKKTFDRQQKYAGKVDKYLTALKGNMPGKKSKEPSGRTKRKGKNGAAEMKGVGGAANLKMAQKVLTQATQKTSTQGKKKNGKKSRR